MTRETKSYELKIYDQSLMRFEAAYDAFGSLKLEITDIDSANAHLLPLNLIVDQDEKSLASWMEGRTIPKNRAFVEQILSTAGLTRNDILGMRISLFVQIDITYLQQRISPLMIWLELLWERSSMALKDAACRRRVRIGKEIN